MEEEEVMDNLVQKVKSVKSFQPGSKSIFVGDTGMPGAPGPIGEPVRTMTILLP